MINEAKRTSWSREVSHGPCWRDRCVFSHPLRSLLGMGLTEAPKEETGGALVGHK